MTRISFAAAVAALLGLAAAPAAAQQMTFFLTSEGPGQGANLGGLAGADAHCEKLAASAGAGGKTWRAYLSLGAADGKAAVNARDRIGSGPWHNAKGVKVAESIVDLHSDNNKLSKENSISEKGEMLNGRGDTPNRHDVLDRLATRRHGLCRRRRPHLQQLDERRRGQRAGRPSRPHGRRRQPDVVELGARFPRLYARKSAGDGRQRAFLLLRRQLGKV